MRLNFASDMFEWRGPSPFYFVRVPDEEAARIAEVASMVTYGWGIDRHDNDHDFVVPEGWRISGVHQERAEIA